MTAELIDQANDLVELNMAHALQRIRIDRNTASAEHCEECGEAIPEARRAAIAGCKTCVDCQQLIELGGAHAR
ncbi:TraR/DksA C4-type zinc finger protein [Kosakonia sacchari]|uniref:TraR/DksA C4-type zinc finger protein n=1 Tax=Kosakonia sacchari TaxID=1158459 RepID=A0ABZ0MKR4_9ENTR|nr:TraR/DksA C4-type zinc finger protein [Kosakonia sacchari]PDO81894.1 conjugal transfer protein TraR [Kosakonia sacchari]WOZ75708.1 TraR/DksA C4-type zinc finger protein [Kosakonia sacchari]